MQRERNTKSNDDERRRYFRIEDSVHLSLRTVAGNELEQRLERLEHNVADSFSLMTSLNAISQQLSANMRRIEQESPDVAEYLKALDHKVNLLSRVFLFEELNVSDKPALPVNLSAGGMAVHSREPMEPETVLEIRMLLMPSYTAILTYGTVVDCVPLEEGHLDPEFPYQVRIDFSFIRDADRDALIRHVLHKQAEWLRQRRERRELGG